MSETHCGTIMAVRLARRVDSALQVQEVLTKHGCAIRMRLGLHETAKDYCAEEGLILLQVCATAEETAALEADLAAVHGVRVKTMALD
jgi:hypothetical protein